MTISHSGLLFWGHTVGYRQHPAVTVVFNQTH